MTTEAYEGWAVVELMGHRRLGGYVREVSQYGAAMLRIDIPGTDSPPATQFYAAPALYGVHPVTEDAARAVAQRNQPEPVHHWELPRPRDDDAEDGEYTPMIPPGTGQYRPDSEPDDEESEEMPFD